MFWGEFAGDLDNGQRIGNMQRGRVVFDNK